MFKIFLTLLKYLLYLRFVIRASARKYRTSGANAHLTFRVRRPRARWRRAPVPHCRQPCTDRLDKAVVARVCQSAFAHECDGTVVGRRGGFLLGAALTRTAREQSRADVSTWSGKSGGSIRPRWPSATLSHPSLSSPSTYEEAGFPREGVPPGIRNDRSCFLALYPRGKSGQADEPKVREARIRHRTRRAILLSAVVWQFWRVANGQPDSVAAQQSRGRIFDRSRSDAVQPSSEDGSRSTTEHRTVEMTRNN